MVAKIIGMFYIGFSIGLLFAMAVSDYVPDQKTIAIIAALALGLGGRSLLDIRK